MNRPHQRNLAILIFDDVEVLDFCGPFEVFSVTGMATTPRPFSVYVVGRLLGEAEAWKTAEYMEYDFFKAGLSAKPRP